MVLKANNCKPGEIQPTFFLYRERLFMSYQISESFSSYILFKKIFNQIADEGGAWKKIVFTSC
jgi:hypothetical protein